MSLGKQIVHYRKSKNITQDALAKQLDISSQAISKWETEQDYPDVELLPKIADIFGITLDELFERKHLVQEPIPAKNSTASPVWASDTVSLPWAEDEKLRVVLFKGHQLIQKDELKERFGRICKGITFRYSGPAQNIESYFSVSCENVAGNVTAGSYVDCEDVGKSVKAGSYVECENVAESVTAGSYVECQDVGQSITAGSYVDCGDVNGNVSAKGNVDCGNVSGNVSAEGNVDCSDVNGSVRANGNVHCG